MDRKLGWLCAAVVLWWTLNGLAVGMQWMLMRDAAGQGVAFWHAMPTSLVGAWGWIPFSLGLIWLAYRRPIEAGQVGRGLLVHGAAIALIIVLRAAYIKGLDPWFHWYDAPPAFSEVLLQSVWNNLFQGWLVVGVAHALFFSERARARERQAVQLQAQLADARLSALTSQLNPHFLFNALNSIAELVHDDPVAADRMIVGLGALLRSSLGAASSVDVPLEDELQLLGYYLDIEKIRLGDRLRVEWSVADDCGGARVPPLLLQPLVENAVRHGVSRRLTPGRIALSARCESGSLVLEVRDDGGGASDGGSGFGLGLATTRARLQALYGAGGRLELVPESNGGNTARLTLPLQRRLAAA
jgi:signal transduction histidine kinase